MEEPGWVTQENETAKWLRAILDKPLYVSPEDMGDIEEFDLWELFPGCVPSYSSSLDYLVIDVLKAVRDGTTFDLLKTRNGVGAELVMHMLAHRLCEYGTSPRGIWPLSDEVKAMWPELIAKWEAYARMKWGAL